MTTKKRLRIDRLRQRVALPEVREALQILNHGGLGQLVRHAQAVLDRAVSRQSSFEQLLADLERSPRDRKRLIGDFLLRTATDRKALRADLRSLSRGRPFVLDPAALGERVARLWANAERSAEASLSVVYAACPSRPAEPADVQGIMELARLPGQWSRRVLALDVLRRIARRSPFAELGELARELGSVREHHWVQPAALALLVAIDPPAALDLALRRLAAPSAGNDLLVRERIVDLAKRRIFGDEARRRIVVQASLDPSDHVRIAAANCRCDREVLTRLAHRDPSPKVRAAALTTLMLASASHGFRRARALISLVWALERDPHPLVVVTASELTVKLARRSRSARICSRLLTALAAAGERRDLGPDVRTSIGEAFAEVSVHADKRLRVARRVIGRSVAQMRLVDRRFLARPDLAGLDDDELGRVLAVLNRSDVALGIDRKRRGLVLYKGEVRRFALWRLLFELTHPSPSKRQAFSHLLGRAPRGALRAPPGKMAETTRTLVPGERVLSEAAGGWGRHVPLIDDLRSTGLFRAHTIALVGPAGTCVIEPPSSWLGRARAWVNLTVGYHRFSELRARSLQSHDRQVQAAFPREVLRTTGIDIRFTPHILANEGDWLVAPVPSGYHVESQTRPERPPAKGPLTMAGAMGLALFGPSLSRAVATAEALARDLSIYATSPGGNRLSHLGAFAALALFAMTGRSVAIRRNIERDRAAIPLVIGGWGTRGKSGTERLKAALFQGLGHECVVKTTGCEAMFIHAIPGLPAREIFMYRPYDKSTIWEQRDVLALARRLGVRVFLWECMALQPELVRLLERDWMQDDFSTITNAYPDHEDVQGPSGYDVANAISEFVPTGGNLLTCEEQMLPIFRQRARERKTRLVHVPARDADLIADDLLTRFPYQEHPRNIALVATLARSFGVPRSIAIAEMADHVVPDLGVLKTYAGIEHLGRTLAFTNGMSANERMGALSNWSRCGFDRHDPAVEPAGWVVTLVNNRGDRPARSEVFARFIVEDISAHRHFLIGTNVRGLVGLIQRALDSFVATIDPMRDLPAHDASRMRTVGARIDEAFRRLKVGPTTAASVSRETEALGWGRLDENLVEQLLRSGKPGESLVDATRTVLASLPVGIDGECRPFLASMIASRRVVRSLSLLVEKEIFAHPSRISEAFFWTYKEIFASQIVVLHDPKLDGDQIIDIIARRTPRGAHVSIVGLQNIKGTGLDFAYRWLSIDATALRLDRTSSDDGAVRERALRELLDHDDYGRFDSRFALDWLTATRQPVDSRERRLREALIAKLRTVSEAKSPRHGGGPLSVWAAVRGWLKTIFDHLLAIGRQRAGTRILAELVAGRISRPSAALAMRELVKQKG
jgi:poly-gamma-glutamate synthase PgsB/CapB